jgi:hypothetical protein
MQWGSSYRARYQAFQAQVDAQLGARGKWGRFKAFFSPNSMSQPRKNLVDQLTREHRAQQLYQPQNIIGYTGQLGNNPTVYYRRNSGTFGHITQAHNLPQNVGQEHARKHSSYQAGNQMVGRTLCTTSHAMPSPL